MCDDFVVSGVWLYAGPEPVYQQASLLTGWAFGLASAIVAYGVTMWRWK